jgi:hypothetical protein
MDKCRQSGHPRGNGGHRRENHARGKTQLRKTKHKKAHKWQIDNIRLYLLKAGGTIRKTVKRIYIKLSKAFVYKDLLQELAFQ